LQKGQRGQLIRNLPGTDSPRVGTEPLKAVSLDNVRAMLVVCGGHSFVDDRDRAMLLTLVDGTVAG
jgi:hypothetical protein